MKIYCVGCSQDVEARLTSGLEIYPHRDDLGHLPFWKCDGCRNFVGCHHKTADPTRPLGIIPTREIREARKHIHRLLDPIWKKKRMTRKEVYAELSGRLGYEYHTGEICKIEEARRIFREVRDIVRKLDEAPHPIKEPVFTARTDFSNRNVYDESIPPWEEQVILQACSA